MILDRVHDAPSVGVAPFGAGGAWRGADSILELVRRAAIAALITMAVMCCFASETRAQGADCGSVNKVWNSNWGMCADPGPSCAANQVGLSGVCVTCPGLSVPDDYHITCRACPSGSHPSSDGGSCVDNGGLCKSNGLTIHCLPSQSCEGLPYTDGQVQIHQCVQNCKVGQIMDDSRQCQPVCKSPGDFYGDDGHCLHCPVPTVAASDHLGCTGCPSGQVASPSQDYCVKPGACMWPQIYSPTNAANPCVSCPPGQVADVGQAKCRSDCRGIGAYDPWTGGCNACTDATVPDDRGTACIGCKDGIPNSKHSKCVACAPGRAPDIGHAACTACRGNTISFDGLGCVVCKYGQANRSHTACQGPVYNPPHVRPLTTNPAIPRQPGGPVIGPGLLENTPGLGTQGPAGMGSRGPRSGGGAR